jgi:D-alanyl-lipoteichoic acid acyltransferase DltB (MBOAT superfamily)
MMPQFTRQAGRAYDWAAAAQGVTLFVLGLCKKTLIADQLAPFAKHVFAAGEAHAALGLVEAWSGALAYTLQLYFDFSGYSDMAIGLALLFGIRLPLNFASPYKAANIIDFWRRWHVTLSRFLRDYLYISLGGNRRGRFRRYLNLFLTMVLGGIWHGAGWTFVVWGAFHGALLIVNHFWRALLGRVGVDPERAGPVYGAVARALTLVAVIIGWVVFRAETMGGAVSVLAGMAGQNGLGLEAASPDLIGALVMLLVVVIVAPNSQEWVGFSAEGRARSAARALPLFAWRPSWPMAAALALAGVVAVASATRFSEFLYYQF